MEGVLLVGSVIMLWLVFIISLIYFIMDMVDCFKRFNQHEVGYDKNNFLFELSLYAIAIVAIGFVTIPLSVILIQDLGSL